MSFLRKQESKEIDRKGVDILDFRLRGNDIKGSGDDIMAAGVDITHNGDDYLSLLLIYYIDS
ncbi:hypothetical protein [Candidatus Tisiphia endosymbiont of Nedyus quadrimaculatus]|uniref:hypothetical protein n=1 Tax=Candidatus Tisiphia endosymbiont of Nedyus quadrimaculatus TaxID=3139332 RepID=UPI00345ED50E